MKNWVQFLVPFLRKRSSYCFFTIWERVVNQVGNQWAVLAKMMPGRSPNAIKNRFHATRRKLERSQKRLNQQAGLIDAKGNPIPQPPTAPIPIPMTSPMTSEPAGGGAAASPAGVSVDVAPAIEMDLEVKENFTQAV
eukprot:392987-Prorocentrum_minimum.AAC.3